jgi:hypothetical protein
MRNVAALSSLQRECAGQVKVAARNERANVV